MKVEFNTERNVWEKIPETIDLGYAENTNWLEKTFEERMKAMLELAELFCKWNNVSNKFDPTVCGCRIPKNHFIRK